jgi:hypothetical protein
MASIHYKEIYSLLTLTDFPGRKEDYNIVETSPNKDGPKNQT